MGDQTPKVPQVWDGPPNSVEMCLGTGGQLLVGGRVAYLSGGSVDEATIEESLASLHPWQQVEDEDPKKETIGVSSRIWIGACVEPADVGKQGDPAKSPTDILVPEGNPACCWRPGGIQAWVRLKGTVMNSKFCVRSGQVQKPLCDVMSIQIKWSKWVPVSQKMDEGPPWVMDEAGYWLHDPGWHKAAEQHCLNWYVTWKEI